MNTVLRTRPRALLRVSAFVALLALGATACAGTGGDERGAAAKTHDDKAARVIAAHSYAVDSSPAAAVTFPLNENVFEGTVVDRRPNVYAKDILDDGSTFEVVYTPVVIRVDEVYKGGLSKGSEVVVRSMGGTADGVRYDIEEAPAKDTFGTGVELFVFATDNEAVDSETDPAMTPNFLYRKTGDTVIDATYAAGAHDGSPADRIGRAEFQRKLRALSNRTAS
ncbi:hypothetical protein [Streptomyces sp. Y7]|uniref:hypothetical protein n=1 Tax=Streptomyces sp. Y7 TaxID=3342392 RepID=UPI0037226F4D